MQNYAPPPSVAHTEHAVAERRTALYELAYLVLVAYLYILAFFAPLVGGVIGLYVMLGAHSPATKRVGKVTLVCAAIGFVLVLAFVFVWVFFIGAAAAMS